MVRIDATKSATCLGVQVSTLLRSIVPRPFPDEPKPWTLETIMRPVQKWQEKLRLKKRNYSIYFKSNPIFDLHRHDTNLANQTVFVKNAYAVINKSPVYLVCCNLFLSGWTFLAQLMGVFRRFSGEGPPLAEHDELKSSSSPFKWVGRKTSRRIEFGTLT